MEIVKVFESGHSQAVRLPKKYRLEESEVFIQRIGNSLIITPKSAGWETFMAGINEFPEDFFADGREQGPQQVRELL